MAPRRIPYIASFVIFLLFSVGCRTVHSERSGEMPVAYWIGVVATDKEGHPAKSVEDEMVLEVLRKSGLHPVLDDQGVNVPENERARAQEVLLTNKRLIGSDVLVLLAVPAGTGKRTKAGIEVSLPALQTEADKSNQK